MTSDLKRKTTATSPWQLLLSATLKVLLWAAPVMLLVTFLKASIQFHHQSTVGYIIGDSGVVLGLCAWKGVRETRLSTRSSAGVFVPWPIAILWSLLLSEGVAILYQVSSVAAMVLVHYGPGGLSQFPRWLSSYWPDPSQAGYPFFVMAVLFVEFYVVVSLLAGCLIALLLPYTGSKSRHTA